MLVSELQEFLKDLDPNTQVILQKDAEGNGYSPLYATGVGFYVPNSTYSGDFYDSDWTAEECGMEDEEWEEMRSAPISFVLAPVN